MVTSTPAQAAPGELEAVRELLNTWLIPNDTRVLTDRFDEWVAAHRLPRGAAATTKRLRDDLRAVVEHTVDGDAVLTAWIERLGRRPAVIGGKLVHRHAPGRAGQLLAAVVDAVAAGRWHRLKACPDCRWVFYDHSRNASKRWCLMNAGGPDGRGCGTIAKVRRHRQRSRDAGDRTRSS